MNAYRISRPSKAMTNLIAATIAATIGVAGFLSVAAPAQAFPPQGSECTQFGFKNSFIVTGHPKGKDDANWTVSFYSNGTTAAGPAVAVFDTGERVDGHVVTGGGIGGRNVTFTVQYDNKPNNFWDFSGTVDDKGFAHGDESLRGGGLPASWTSPTALDCLAPQPPLITGVPRVDPPPAQVPAPKAPQNAVTVDFARSGLQEIVTVSNTANLAGKCTYVATPTNNPLLPQVNRSFDVAANGAQQLTVLAPPAFATYHVVVSCIGTFNGQSVEFGHVEKNVSG